MANSMEWSGVSDEKKITGLEIEYFSVSNVSYLYEMEKVNVLLLTKQQHEPQRQQWQRKGKYKNQ